MVIHTTIPMDSPTTHLKIVCKELYQKMMRDDMYIVKTITGYDMVQKKDSKGKKILHFEDVVVNRTALMYLLDWAVYEMLPEDK